MLRFINGDDSQWQWLRGQIQGALLSFENIELPSTCRPQVVRIGFEYTPATAYILFIQKGIVYTGANPVLAAFFEQGQKSFETFDDMRNFIVSLAPDFEGLTETKSP